MSKHVRGLVVGLVMLLVLSSLALGDGAVPFGARQVVDVTGDNPRTVVAADLDSDGDLDLISTALVDPNGDFLRWHESSGGANPTYTTHLINSVERRAREIWVADIDRDGDLDIAAAYSQDKTIMWFENLGGSPLAFAQHVIVADITNAWSVYVSDVDHDGDMDVLSVGGQTEDTVNWHENEGGSPIVWTRRIIDNVAVRAEKVFVDDVNGDGALDILSASSGGASREIAWYESDGAVDPVFTKHALTNNLTNAKWVWTSDLDSDGDKDVIGVGEFDGEIRWWENDGGSSPVFTQHLVGIVTGAKGASPIDLDFDGDIDLLAHGVVDDEIVFFENTGGAPLTFARHVVTTESDNPLTVFPADLDADGDADLAATSFTDDTVGWYENESSPLELSIVESPILLGGGDMPVALGKADLDRDGRVDLIVASRDDGSVWWHRNLGGTPVAFEQRLISSAFRGPRDVEIVDLDRDGDMDVLAASLNDDAVVWHRNDGGVPLVFTDIAIGGFVSDARSVASADFDHDGDTDVIAAALGSNQVVLIENDGNSPPAFTPRIIASGITGPVEISLGDMNQDGTIDAVVAARTQNAVVVLSNQGGPTPLFTALVVPGSITAPKDISVLDYDRDGDLDILSGSSTDNTITLHENTDPSTLQFSLSTLATAPVGFKSFSFDDIDHDGDIDLLAAGSGSGDVLWYEQTDARALMPTVAFTGLTMPSSVLLADVTGDSVPDLIAADQGDDAIHIQELTQMSSTVGAHITVASSAPALFQENELISAFMIDIEHFIASGEPMISAVETTFVIVDEFGAPYNRSTANSLFISFQIYADDGSGDFDPGLDSLLHTAFFPKFELDGTYLMPLSGAGGIVQIPSLEARMIHCVFQLKQDAVENAPPLFRLELNPASVVLGSPSMMPVETTTGPAARTPLITPIPNVDNRLVGPAWRRHTIDDSLLGAESAHLADMDDDGLLDIVVGWEQAGVATMYFNPGPSGATGPWTRVVTGVALGTETSVPYDLDSDGRIDIVSALEGGQLMVHWAPPLGQDIMDPLNWTEMVIDHIPGERWGPLEAIDIDGVNGPDLVLGGLGIAGDFDVPIAWLKAPANPRDPAAWTYHELGVAAFVTSIVPRDMDGDGDQDIAWTDRLFDPAERAAWWFENPGAGAAQVKPWTVHLIGSEERMPMIMDLADVDGDGLEDVVVPDRDFFPAWHRRVDATGLAWSSYSFAWPSDMGHPKACRVGDIDLDGNPDFVVTAVKALEDADLVGVGWVRQPLDPTLPEWLPFNIGGADGEKFDRIELLDIDADGDLDVITTEERNNSLTIFGLGVVWYENPTIETDGDISRNGVTDSADLAMLLAAWNAGGLQLPADLNNDGVVDSSDLAILLAGWGHQDLDADP